MNNIARSLVVLGLCGLAVGAIATELRTGMTREELEAELGPPQGAVPVQGRVHLLYPYGAVPILSNRVVSMSTQFIARVEEQRRATAFEAEQKAKGLVSYDSQWISLDELSRRQAEKNEAEAKILRGEDRKVREVREGGRRIELASILVPGKITVVDFFADWCPPCRALSPRLIELAHEDSEVYLCKIDVVGWESEAAVQNGIKSLPDVRVFGRDGRKIESSLTSFEDIAAAVKSAK